jgi:excisionase family DNA binding protein
MALSIRETATTLGVSEGLVRKWLSELPHMHLGERILIPVEGLRGWLEARARAENEESKRSAEAILAHLDRSR